MPERARCHALAGVRKDCHKKLTHVYIVTILKEYCQILQAEFFPWTDSMEICLSLVSVQMPNSQSSQLDAAMRDRCLIRFSRRFESSSICGYVLDIGSAFFLLALVSDRIWFDGFECFRIEDVGDVHHDPYSNFAETALRLRKQEIPEAPRIKLGNITELLQSANVAFPLVTIHREEQDPDVCHIGHAIEINRDTVSLQEINADATWDESPTEYQLNEITRVNFGGDYEDALHLVGGRFNAR